VNQTRPYCVNQMEKTHSNPLAARHGRGTACYVWIGLKMIHDGIVHRGRHHVKN